MLVYSLSIVVTTTNLEAYKDPHIKLIVSRASSYLEVLGRICSLVP